MSRTSRWTEVTDEHVVSVLQFLSRRAGQTISYDEIAGQLDLDRGLMSWIAYKAFQSSEFNTAAVTREGRGKLKWNRHSKIVPPKIEPEVVEDASVSEPEAPSPNGTADAPLMLAEFISEFKTRSGLTQGLFRDEEGKMWIGVPADELLERLYQ